MAEARRVLAGFSHRIQLPGHVQVTDLDDQVRRHLSGSDNALVSASSVAIDLSECTFLDIDATLRLVVLLAELKRSGATINLILPALGPDRTAASDNLWSFLLRWRFFDALRRHVDHPENLLSPSQVDHLYDRSRYEQSVIRDSANQMTLLFTHRLMAINSVAPDRSLKPLDDVDAFLSEYRDLLLFRALTQECGFSSENAGDALSFIAEEGILNAVVHGQGTFAVIAMQTLEDLSLPGHPSSLVVTVSDDGIGIPEVLKAAHRDGRLRLPELPSQDDELLLLYTSFEVAKDSLLVAASMRRETTTSPDREGMGLYFLKEESEKFGARLTIRSGRALLRFRGADVSEKRDDCPYYRGTTIRVDIPVR